MNQDKEIVSGIISLVNIQCSCFVELLGVLTMMLVHEVAEKILEC